MASLRSLVSENRKELQDGIMWIAFYRNGRTWESKVLASDIDYDNYRIIVNEDESECLNTILSTDSNAIIVNGCYINIGGTVDTMYYVIKSLYEKKACQLHQFFANAQSEPVKEEAEPAQTEEVSELAKRICDCLSDGYDDEESREETENALYNELAQIEKDSFIKAALIRLCERIED